MMRCKVKIVRQGEGPLFGDVSNWLQNHKISWRKVSNSPRYFIIELDETDALHFKLCFELSKVGKSFFNLNELDISLV